MPHQVGVGPSVLRPRHVGDVTCAHYVQASNANVGQAESNDLCSPDYATKASHDAAWQRVTSSLRVEVECR